ncbi:MAG: di-heme oxidoredictase family protein [Parvibaculaceae bacterium]
MSRIAFSLFLAGIVLALPARADPLDAVAGKALFDRRWVQAPASTKSADGLGPLFSAQACATCHKAGGPARFVETEDGLGSLGLVVRLGTDKGVPDPFYGRQIQERAIPGLVPEARVRPRLASAVSLRLMQIEADLDLTGPALGKGVHKELRAAPSLRGRGLIAEVDAAAILALADPEDRDKDGISGRARMLPDGKGGVMLGRFGLKAGRASIADQAADAASLDMGLSSPFHPLPQGDCTAVQTDCALRAGPDKAEIGDQSIELIAIFVATLQRPPVPNDPKGEALFAKAGCTQCHVPSLPKAQGGEAAIFSDLLLHDMGEGLSGRIGDGDVDPAEWRTAPLIDLAQRPQARRYLHDGRAGSIEEAILWHGGEAEASRNTFQALGAEERKALIDYVSRL